MQALHMREVTFAVEVTSITLKLNGQHVDCAQHLVLNRNVFISFSFAVITIVRIFNTSAFRVPKNVTKMTI